MMTDASRGGGGALLRAEVEGLRAAGEWRADERGGAHMRVEHVAVLIAREEAEAPRELEDRRAIRRALRASGGAGGCRVRLPRGAISARSRRDLGSRADELHVI